MAHSYRYNFSFKTPISRLTTLNYRMCFFVNKTERESMMTDLGKSTYGQWVDNTMGRPSDSCQVSSKSKYISTPKSE